MPTASSDSAASPNSSPSPNRASSSVSPEALVQVHPEAPVRGGDYRVGLSSLVRALASSLVLEPVGEPELAPFVYTAAIHTTADLVSSLVGITELSREKGFSRDPETNYCNGGRNATYHVDHRELPVSLIVNCNPLRQTVAIAVSGLDGEETHRCFQELELALFGGC
jgi:hypothetical protein